MIGIVMSTLAFRVFVLSYLPCLGFAAGDGGPRDEIG